MDADAEGRGAPLTMAELRSALHRRPRVVGGGTFRARFSVDANAMRPPAVSSAGGLAFSSSDLARSTPDLFSSRMSAMLREEEEDEGDKGAAAARPSRSRSMRLRRKEEELEQALRLRSQCDRLEAEAASLEAEGERLRGESQALQEEAARKLARRREVRRAHWEAAERLAALRRRRGFKEPVQIEALMQEIARLSTSSGGGGDDGVPAAADTVPKRPALDEDYRSCPVCLEPPAREIFCCVGCDGMLCGSCRVKVARCPICRRDFFTEPPRRNKFAERLMGLYN